MRIKDFTALLPKPGMNLRVETASPPSGTPPCGSCYLLTGLISVIWAEYLAQALPGFFPRTKQAGVMECLASRSAYSGNELWARPFPAAEPVRCLFRDASQAFRQWEANRRQSKMHHTPSAAGYYRYSLQDPLNTGEGTQGLSWVKPTSCNCSAAGEA